MGNGITKLTLCFSTGGSRPRRRRIDSAAVTSEPFDEGLGHSFCYMSSMLQPEPNLNPTLFHSISGASVSANVSTALSTALPYEADASTVLSAAAFDSSTSFSSYPLYPIPRFLSVSGPIDRGFLSGPLDPRASAPIFSGPLDRRLDPLVTSSAARMRRSFSNGARMIHSLSKAISRTVSVPVPVRTSKESSTSSGSVVISDNADNGKLQWAQGKAGEDRVHVVVSEEHGWVFVGIYDGFNGPDATDYLSSNLYSAVQSELKGLLWVEDEERSDLCDDGQAIKRKRRKRKTEWKCDWEKEGKKVGCLKRTRSLESANHGEVLKAMSRALMKTEDGFFDIADRMSSENPELALMGSCVLAMLMKGEDVYLMNVGDSRAVLGHKAESRHHDLGRIGEESFRGDDRLSDWDLSTALDAWQLTLDHSTCVKEEVRRIKSEHLDDACAVMNDRVKGSLKVTRAFGAGFLKQPKWNDALLEIFRIDYIGTSPYITCNPFLYHHKLGPKDKFLILSSDGLYQYFTNEEAVAEVELFVAINPEGDPAQHLVEEVIFRAAKKAGLDFHELLEIPQGDRRRYHDDVSIIVISFEGRIWRSCV